jgi:hypothetical protein
MCVSFDGVRPLPAMYHEDPPISLGKRTPGEVLLYQHGSNQAAK